MGTASDLFLALDLTGTFAFALNGALTAIRVAKIDIVGVLVLGIMTAMGGGIIRDVTMGSLPPTTFGDWRYFAVAAAGSLCAFGLNHVLDRLLTPIVVMDAAGLGLFAVTGALKGMNAEIGFVQAVILGVVTAVGGGTVRDVMTGRIPLVLRSELYAIPALLGALTFVTLVQLGAPEIPAGVGAAVLCFAVRLVGVRYDLHAPGPRGPQPTA